MESNQVVMRASLQGMISKLVKLGVYFLAVLFIWRRIRNYQTELFDTYNVSYLSALTNALETDIEMVEVGLLVVSYMAMIVVIVLFLYLGYLTLRLLSQLTGVTVIDFDNNRILEKKYLFPVQRIEDENVFHQIIQVRIEQNLIDRTLKSGHLYVEYLVLSKLDSQLRFLEVPFIADPERVKRKLI